ncbi:MAG: glutamate formiminotransferase [Actinomycetota bacterium]|nr:glutamate formiminotransferase [Actinomycetota bacterium]
MTTLLAYPNVSEGRDSAVIAAVGAAFGPGLLDVHSDPDHHRSAYTLAGDPATLPAAIIAGAVEAMARLTLDRHDGVHPRIGVLDVAPIVHLEAGQRGVAAATALVLADGLGELGLPVFLYGALAAGLTRAQLRRGGPHELAARIASGELRPDFGPGRLHRPGGAVLVAARPPLVAFNVELKAGATLQDARAIAAAIREGGSDGLPGVRAIGLWLAARGCAQVSTNVEDPGRVALADVVAAVARHGVPAEAELVGLTPVAALDGFPDGVPLRGVVTIEGALARRAHTA